MIAYFDTSAIVPLIVEEPTTERCQELWRAASRLVSVRLAHVEARAALAQALRIGRITPSDVQIARRTLETLLDQVDLIEVDASLVDRAGALAEALALRAYDAVHLAAALTTEDHDLVVVAGDRALLQAAGSVGVMTAAAG